MDLIIKCKFIVVLMIILLSSNNIVIAKNNANLIIKKQNWIKSNGTIVWVGLEFERKKMLGCRINDNSVIVYKSWGLAKLYSTQEIIHCPAFFYQTTKKTNKSVE